jgi:hypothetical protein
VSPWIKRRPVSGNEGSCYTKTAKSLPQTGSVTQPVSAPTSRSRVFARKCPKSSARTSGRSLRAEWLLDLQGLMAPS